MEYFNPDESSLTQYLRLYGKSPVEIYLGSSGPRPLPIIPEMGLPFVDDDSGMILLGSLDYDEPSLFFYYNKYVSDDYRF